jgi:AraC family transcriptional regulator
LAEIAAELNQALAWRHEHGLAGCTSPRIIATGEGWSVADVVCTCGPVDRPFEEQHARYAIAVVLAGSFEYRSPAGPALLTPGSLMLGNSGQCFECGHAHGEGDRCVSFWFAPDGFERLAADVGIRGRARFAIPRIPPLRAVSPLVTGAALGLASPSETPWEELSAAVAAGALRLSRGMPPDRRGSPLNADARVTHAVRAIDRYPAGTWTLARLASAARLSPYHFLRTFTQLTGVTPHQYVRRARLRDAAVRLVRESGSVLDIALDCGFGDVSNFTRAFRIEFGASPGRYRERSRRR